MDTAQHVIPTPPVVPESLLAILRAHDALVRCVGNGPTYEASAVATPQLIADLNAETVVYATFVADNRLHRDYGRQCVSFQFYGDPFANVQNAQWEQIDEEDMFDTDSNTMVME